RPLAPQRLRSKLNCSAGSAGSIIARAARLARAAHIAAEYRQGRRLKRRGAPVGSEMPLASCFGRTGGAIELAEAKRMVALGCHLALIETCSQVVTEKGPPVVSWQPLHQRF